MMGRAGGPENVSFRRFSPEDITSCAILAKEAWPYRRENFTSEEEVSAMKGYVESAQMMSNWGEVAFDPTGVVGILFGRLDRDWDRLRSLKILAQEFVWILVSIVNERGGRMLSLGLLRSLLMTETKLAFLRPRTGAEIELLIVASSRRGEGIGKALVERFFREAKKWGAERVTVYTDNKSSNWGFYERMGFEKVAMFHDNVASYYDNRPTSGIVYKYELGSRDIVH